MPRGLCPRFWGAGSLRATIQQAGEGSRREASSADGPRALAPWARGGEAENEFSRPALPAGEALLGTQRAFP